MLEVYIQIIFSTHLAGIKCFNVRMRMIYYGRGYVM